MELETTRGYLTMGNKAVALLKGASAFLHVVGGKWSHVLISRDWTATDCSVIALPDDCRICSGPNPRKQLVAATCS